MIINNTGLRIFLFLSLIPSITNTMIKTQLQTELERNYLSEDETLQSLLCDELNELKAQMHPDIKEFSPWSYNRFHVREKNLNEYIKEQNQFKAFEQGLKWLILDRTEQAKACFKEACEPIKIKHTLLKNKYLTFETVTLNYRLSISFFALGGLAIINENYKKAIGYFIKAHQLSSERCDTAIEDRSIENIKIFARLGHAQALDYLLQESYDIVIDSDGSICKDDDGIWNI